MPQAKTVRQQLSRPSVIAVSALFSLWTYFGLAIMRTGSTFGYLQDALHVGLSVIALLGAWVAFALLTCLAFRLLDALGKPANAKPEAPSWRTSTLVFLVILLCWVPYLLVCFPGYINFDYFNQLNQFVGARQLNNHHPVAMTFFLGAIYEAGHLVGGASGGLFLTVVLQALCLDGLFCWLHRSLCRMGVRRGARVAVVLFCALCPVFPLYACVLVKDTFSAIVVGLFAVQVAGRAWYDRQGADTPRMVSLPAITAVGMLCSLTRANCVYLVLGVLLVCLFCLGRTRRLATLACMATVAAFYLGWTNVLLPAAGVTPSDTALVISIPLQQTGAFARGAADEATPEEREAIEALLATDYDQVGELYTPNIVDPLQSAARAQADDRVKLKAYLKVWVSQGLRRPDIYVDALLHANVGYWFPGIPFHQLQDLDYMQNTPASHLEAMRPLGYAFSGDLSDMSTAVAPFQEQRDALEGAFAMLAGIPILGLVLQPAFYGWACLLVGLWGASRKRSSVPLFALAILLFLVECASPLAASLRYALPLVVLTPIIFGTALAPTAIRHPRHAGATRGTPARRRGHAGQR